MEITAIIIENFKGIREPVRVELKPITLLFGPNSAGKSTIVHALHYAREIFERQNLNPGRTILGGDSIDLGGFENMVHNHDKSLSIIIGFELDLSRTGLPSYLDSQLDGYTSNDPEKYAEMESNIQDILERVTSVSVQVTVSWSEILERPFLAKYSVSINNSKFSDIESSADSRQINISFLNPFHSIFRGDITIDELKNSLNKRYDGQDLSDDENEKFDAISYLSFILVGFLVVADPQGKAVFINIENQDGALPRWGRPLQMKFPDVEPDPEREYQDLDLILCEQVLSSLIVGSGELVFNSLRKLSYLGPLREVPPRNYEPARSPDESRWASGLAAWDICYSADEPFIDKVNEWLIQEERLDSGYSVELKKYREIETDNPFILAVLQGRILDEDIDLSGSLLALPVKRRLLIRDVSRNIELAPQDIGIGISQALPVVVAALHRKTGLVAIEQPELHIHPAFQVALGDLFIEQVQECPDLTFILETHSEHLMLRFLRRIRETGEKEALETQTLTPAELSIYFIEQDETGISCLPIQVDKNGEFINRWPHGFFAERAGELF